MTNLSPYIRIFGEGVFRGAVIPLDSPVIYLTIWVDSGSDSGSDGGSDGGFYVVLSTERNCPHMNINDTVVFSCCAPHIVEGTVVWRASFIGVVQTSAGAKKP